ncbi:MAG: hypothetical protein IKO72_07080 [Kiritimatiellae bacterium]|nr:hypothetical protein [Kiritimatiellia bacterium]
MNSADRHYDFVFSLGQACPCSMTLRMANLQFASFPLDWIRGGTLGTRTDLVVSRFAGWLEPEDFEYHGVNPKNGLGIFENRRTGFSHLHDFDPGPIERSLDKVREKYRRRSERFYQMLERGGRMLCVYICRSAGPELQLQEIDGCLRSLSRAFPRASFDFLLLAREEGVPFAERKISSPAPGVTRIAFDYYDPERDVALELAAQAIVELGVTAVDYRTDAERSAFARDRMRQDRDRKRKFRLKRKMEKYGVDTRLGLFIARVKDRLGRLFGRRRA